MSHLRSLKAGTAVTAYSQSVECLCSWGQISHIVELIENWLVEAVPVREVNVLQSGHVGVLRCLRCFLVLYDHSLVSKVMTIHLVKCILMGWRSRNQIWAQIIWIICSCTLKPETVCSRCHWIRSDHSIRPSTNGRYRGLMITIKENRL